MNKFSCLLLLVTLFVFSWAQCRWAKQFTKESLLNSELTRKKFQSLVLFWEGKFHSDGMGYNKKSGMSYDGRRLDFITGEPKELHYWTASSKESLHLNMMTLALNGNEGARIFFYSSLCPPELSFEKCLATYSWSKTRDLIYEILDKKIKTYMKFVSESPGFGGQIPWVLVDDQGFKPDRPWVSRTPGLDNGQLGWSVIALNFVLKKINSKKSNDLFKQYEIYLDLFKKTAPIIFYEGDGKIRTVTVINNTRVRPFPSNYRSESPCGNPCYLDDPYEGELLAFFLYFYGDNIPDKEKIWERKREKLVSVDYPSKKGKMTCQRGHWFSSHEQWKFLYLPYNDVPIHKRIFINGEKTINSYEKKIPGLFASVTNVTHGNEKSGYLSAAGVQEVASEKVHVKDVITPYGSYPLFLANQTVGLVWYHHMLLGSKMQNRFGSTESITTDGKRICPLTTWDSKILTVLSMLGGITDILTEQLKLEGNYKKFTDIVNREWGRVFKEVRGEHLDYQFPSQKLPDLMENFKNCQ